MTMSSIPVAVAFVLAVLAVTAYLAAAVDALVGAQVAGRRVSAAAAVAPARRAAWLLLTRRSTTRRPDAAAWALGPGLLGAMAAAAIATVPWSPTLAAARGHDGIVLVGAAFAAVMVGVFLHGWAANAPMSISGGYRFAALALSFEMPLALVLIAAALPAESLALGDIVESQAGLWNVVRQPLGLPLYLVAGLGLASWGPLRQSDARDLAGGTRSEVAGPDRLAWSAAQLAVLGAVAVVGAAVFLGGWQGPLLPAPVWMGAKVLALLVVLAWIGHRVARVRLERFVVVSWAVFIPLALVDVFVSGVLAL